jgi:hypothetical protein
MNADERISADLRREFPFLGDEITGLVLKLL